VDTGPVPAQADLDAWARRQTLGLIDRFPLEDGSTLIWLLATALAARVSWERPFDLAAASALGPASPWATTLTRVLRTPQGPGTGRVPEHDQFIAATDAAGDVAVHAASARDRLLAVSAVRIRSCLSLISGKKAYDGWAGAGRRRLATWQARFHLRFPAVVP
jgi:hypothetical protein